MNPNDRSRGRGVGRLPSFLLVGPPRTGTTWLHGVLYHRACLPERTKETHFFDMFYHKGLDWYRAYFRGCPEEAVIGEVTPTYFGLPQVRERIARDLPGCKIVCTLRDPVARAYSHYRKLQSTGKVRGSFIEEVSANAELREASQYALHLRAWRDLFGDENVGTFFYDDLEADEQRFADAVCCFVGVPSVALTHIAQFLDRNQVKHASRNQVLARSARRFRYWLQGHHALRLNEALNRAGVWRFCYGRGEEFAPLEPEVEAKLREYFLPEVEGIEKLTKRDLSAWKLPSPVLNDRIAARVEQ